MSYLTAWQWWKQGRLPVPAHQTPSGTILVDVPEQATGRTVVYARVSSHDQRNDLDRQVARVTEWATSQGLSTGAAGDDRNEGGRLMRVLQAYRFALDPSPRVLRALASHTGARRFAFNRGLALVKRCMDARARGEVVEVPWTLPALRREWNRQKEAVAPWWRENSKEAYSAGLDGLARALRNWSDSRKGKRKGRRVGFPRFRKKGRGRSVEGT